MIILGGWNLSDPRDKGVDIAYNVTDLLINSSCLKHCFTKNKSMLIFSSSLRTCLCE